MRPFRSMAASALLVLPPLLGCAYTASATVTTTYLEVRRSSLNADGNLNTRYVQRMGASGSTFAPDPPKGTRSSTEDPLGLQEQIATSVYSSYHLAMPPPSDPYLCHESDGLVNYKSPTGNTNTDWLEFELDNKYILVPRGKCSFEAKARSAQRLGAAGVVIRNALESRYMLNLNRPRNQFKTFDVDKREPDWGRTIWPKDMQDYECGNRPSADNTGYRAEVRTSLLKFYPAPYDPSWNNDLLTGSISDGNICAMGGATTGGDTAAKDFEKHCPSKKCLLTGENATGSDEFMVACCAWDVPSLMGADGNDGDAVPEAEEEPLVIPALFVTMADGDTLLDALTDAEANTGTTGAVEFVTIVPYARWYPSFHYTTIGLWMMAVFAVFASSYASAKDSRTSWNIISLALEEGVLVFQTGGMGGRRNRGRANTEDTMDADDDDDDDDDDHFDLEENHDQAEGGGHANANGGDGLDDLEMRVEMTERNSEASGTGGAPANADANANAALAQTPTPTPTPTPTEQTQETQEQLPARILRQPASPASSYLWTAQPDHLQLHAWHAVGFVAVASAMLFLLFFFRLYNSVRLVYGVGGGAVMSSVLFVPMYDKAAGKVGLRSVVHANFCGSFPGCRGTKYKLLDILSLASGYSLAIAWLYVGFSRVDPMANAYYWIVMDIMGVCFCILILGLLRINTMMVATVLLSVVFFYDVFYVFITPYIFGTSIMVDVATGSGTLRDHNHCEKYPDDKDCRGIFAPLPMVLSVPWEADYRGGHSLIGLGDIALPGLLLSFAARLDAAKSLVKKCSAAASRARATRRASAETPIENEGAATPDVVAIEVSPGLGSILREPFRGYFGPLVIAYAVGLLAAYVAVWGMDRGQPALLYLVPSCLGTLFVLGWCKGEARELWNGPPVMAKADRIIASARKIPRIRVSASASTSAASADAATGDLAETRIIT